ncbi:MAG: hypothetical protein NPMRTH4_1800002 [Nitrosopumilales archaeon]|nr:MAG: hypothetical protein NPMRTH4_1800002 [Nitrosopumilales archaeon]
MSSYEENGTLRILNSLCNVSLDKFNDRLILQKLGYLAQSLGASGGFNFSWYLRGPYSPILTKMLYKAEKSGVFKKKPNLYVDEKKIVKKLKKLLKNELDDPQKLELYASVWYLIPKQDVTQGDVKYIIDTIREEKPDYSINEIKNTIETVLKFKTHEIVYSFS